MGEYISREAAIVAIKNLYPGIPLVKFRLEKWHEENKNFMECELAIEHIPAAEVRPVVRGEWLLEREPDGTPYQFHCSVCDGDFSFMGITTKYKYCPNCGADMREGC